MIDFTPKEHLKQIKILHGALLLGMCLMLAMLCAFVVQFPIVLSFSMEHLSMYIIGIGTVLIGGGIMSPFLFGKAIQKASNEPTLQKKMEGYRSAIIIRDALREAGGLINIIFFAFIEPNAIFLAGAVITIITFIASFPSQIHAISSLNLTRDEGDELV